MKIRLSNTRWGNFAAMISFAFLLTVGTRSLAAQDQTSQQDRPFTQSYDRSSGNIYYDRTRAVPRNESRAEQEANRLVSLSADKIISLLTAEPGLLLECKKALVRAAFEQGRLLDREDLTDDAVFSLVRGDENVRSMFTQEISDRNYIHAKPTKEELQQDWMAGLVPATGANAQASAAASAASAAQNAQAKSLGQEDVYWLRHEDDLLRTPNPLLSAPGFGTSPPNTQPGAAPSAAGVNNSPGIGPQQQGPLQNSPQAYPSYDPRRALLQAQSSGAFGDYSDSGSSNGLLGMGSGGQMSSLLSARMSSAGGGMNGSMGGLGGSMSGNQSSLFGGHAGMGGFGQGGLSSPFGGMTSGLGGLGVGSSLFGGSAQFPQPASLNAGQIAQLPPTYGTNSFPNSQLDVPRQPPITRRPNPYADIPSLYDLYQQYSRISPTLDRFGIDVFQNGTGNFDELPMDMPVGPEYVLGPGDDLSIELTGSVSDHMQRVVDREGRVVFPDYGAVQIAGKSLGDAQRMVQSVLRTQYRDVQVDLSLARVRTVRVYVVGDVERPGPYDVSSLSTPLNAVYEAGGPTSGGSLRIFKHYRGKDLIEEVDVYNLLLHGVPTGMHRLESGDTVLVPPLGAQVTLEGMVRRPAIYELNQETSLAEVLQTAGGVLPSGTLRHVDVERVVAHDTRSMLRLDIPENNNAADVTKALQDFQIQDGDKIKISPILPYADKTVYLEGHVFRPGKFAYRDGMKVTDLVKSYKDLLPEPYKQHAEIIRLKKPDNTPEVFAFNLEDALAGKDQDLVLQPFDTVRVFGRFDFEDTPVITVTGAVRDPGDHITNGTAYLRDAVYLAGGTSPEASLSDAQVFRKTDNGKLKVFSVDLRRALDGDPKDNIVLEPKDRIFVHKDLNKVDPPTVTIQGEVARPGKYPLGDAMTAADLVRFAGGLKRGAYADEADLTSYMVEHGSKMVSDHQTVQIAKALEGEPDTDVRLHDGDVLAIRQLSGWEDMGATIQVKGEVAHPGGYGIQPGERLSSVIARAGGFLSNAYPYGAILERAQVRELEEKNRADLIQRVQVEALQVKLLPGMDGDQQIQTKAAVLQYQKTIEQLQNIPPAGRLVIHISSDVKRWANTSADIQVRAGDVVRIPKRPGIVLVDGAVFNPTAITYKPGKSAGWYLKQAGGPTDLANKREMFVVRADGSVAGGRGGLFSGSVQTAELRPGDMIVVPEQTYSFSTKFKTVLQAAQLATAVGLSSYYISHF
ncbi:MAG TPA: SLBB domain-containing protein [Terriglobales bacterium]|nr:SLBB domain-containing protein [Terriglobales bacterium]